MNTISSIFLFMVFINTAKPKSHHYPDMNPTHNSITVRNYFANLLKSLVDLNEQRIKTLNQLHMLNKIDFGKILRTDKNIDYDEIIMSIASIMSLLSNNDEIEYIKDKGEADQINKISRAGSKRFDNGYDFNDNDITEQDKVNKKGYMSCGRPALRCIWSCYDALERACRSDDCGIDFEIQMESSCKTACLNRFFY